MLCNAATDFVSVGTGVLTDELSIAFWLNTAWAHTDGVQHYFFSKYTDANNFFSLLKFTDNKLYFGWKIAGVDTRVVVASGAYAIAAGAWTHIGFRASTTLANGAVFVNGASVGSTAESDGGSQPGGAAVQYIGNIDTDGNAACEVNLDASLEHYARWNTRISDAQFAALAARASPLMVQRANLVDYLTLQGGDAGLVNLAGGTAGTNNGTDATAGIGLTVGAGRGRGRGRGR